MSKVFNYVMIITGMILLLSLIGIPTSTGLILGTLGLTSPESLGDFQTSTFWTTIYLVMVSLAGVGGIAIGIFGKSSISESLSATIGVAIVGAFTSEMFLIVKYMNSQEVWLGWVAFLIFAPLTLGFLLSIWEWIRGTG